jgi:hypothetical protein
MPVEREGFGITVPMTWWEFDLHTATRDDSVRRLLAQRVRENPSPPEHREVLGRLSLVGARTPDGSVLAADPASVVAGLRPKEAAREGATWRRVTTVDIPETRLAARTFGIEDVAVCRATRGPCGRS